MHESAYGRYCCKSLFALVIKNSPGCRRDFRVKMWGTSSPDDKLTGDLGNVIEATQIGGRRSDRLTAGKLSPGNFGLLQQYLPQPCLCMAGTRGEAHRSGAGQQTAPSFNDLVSAAEQREREAQLPSVLAVLTLMTSSTFVGWITGKSLGFAPLRIPPVYTAT